MKQTTLNVMLLVAGLLFGWYFGPSITIRPEVVEVTEHIFCPNDTLTIGDNP